MQVLMPNTVKPETIQYIANKLKTDQNKAPGSAEPAAPTSISADAAGKPVANDFKAE